MEDNLQAPDSQPSMPDHFLIQEAIELMRAKRPQEARSILKQYLRINPYSEKGWLLLSYVVEENSQKIDCLRRVLDLNPTHWRAQERLDQFKANLNATPSKAAKPRRRGISTWVVVASMGLIGLLILVAGIWGYQSLLSKSSPGIQAQAVAQATFTPSPTRQPSIAFATATAMISPTPIPPTHIPATPALLANDIVDQMDEIQSQVSELRGLEARESVPRTLLVESQVQSMLETLYLARHTKDEVADQARVLSALGLIEPTYDLYSKTLNQIGEGLGGFYIPWTDELYVIGTEFSGIERFVFAHEYTHALADQYYALEAIGVYPECIIETDRCLAISALIEGDATYLMYEWLEKYGTEADLKDILEAQYAPIDKTISSTNLPPPYLVRETQFRYGDGYSFIQHLYERGKWKMVDLAYATLPETTEQILHPDKYQIREPAISVETPALEDILGNGWRLLATDALGELGTQMILGYSANRLTHLDPVIVAKAAEGWGGDQYQMFYKDTTNQKVLAVNWIWDSWPEEDQFWEALQQYMTLRYRSNRVADQAEMCWEYLNDHYSCVFHSQYQTLWVMAPDLDMLFTIRAQYADFQ